VPLRTLVAEPDLLGPGRAHVPVRHGASGERNGNREEWLAATLVELADTLVDEFDMVDFLSLLARRCVELFGAVEAGLMLADPAGNLRYMASSSERAKILELFESWPSSSRGPSRAESSSNKPRAGWRSAPGSTLTRRFRNCGAIPAATTAA
jgi:hypothetical protein